MISVSNAFKQELQNDNRDYLVTVVLGVKNSSGDTITLTLDNSKVMSNGLSIDDAVSSDDSFTAIGSTIINSVELLIDNADDAFSEYDFDNAPCTISVGLTLEDGTIEKFRKFTGFVDSPKYNNAIIALTVYDPMIKFNKPYDSTIVYPVSTEEIIEDACVKCGVDMNSATIILDGPITTLSKRPPIESTTYLDVISWIAAINGKFARCNAYGLLEIKWFDTATLTNYLNQIDETIDADFTDASDIHVITGLKTQSISTDKVIITGVKVVVETESEEAELESVEFTAGSTDYVIELSNNPFITLENAQTIVDYLGTKLIGTVFRKADISHLSDPTIEAGDVALIYDRKSRTFPILVTRTKFSVSRYQQTVCGAETPVRNALVQYPESVKNYIDLRKSLKENTNLLNQRIATANGLYTTEIVDESGATIKYLHNQRLLENSDIQIQISDVGVLVTSDGTSQSPTWYGLTVNGSLIASILRATGIDADWITTGRISAENGDTYFDLTRGYFAITSQNSLYRLVLRGWSAALIIQHRTSTDQDWNNSIEMGAQTTDTYEIGEIYASGAGPDGNVTAIAAFPVYYLGSYHNRKTFASVNSNGYSSVSANIMTAQNYDETDVRDGYCQVEPYSINFWQKDGTALKCYLSIQANVDNETSIAAPQGNLIIKALNDGVIDTQADFKHSIAILDDEKLKRLYVWSNNVSFYTRANTSSEFTRDGYIYNNGTDLQISSEHGNLVLSGKLISAQADFKHSIAILNDGNLKRLYVWSDNISFYTRANTSSGFTRKNNIYSNGTNLVLNSDSGKVLISHNNENVGPAIGGGSGSDLTKVLKQMYLSTSSGTTFAMFVPFSGSKTYYVTLATTSDERIKKNIKESKENALETIEKIKHVSFDFRENDVHRDNGYIAQQLEEVNPAFVSLMENPNGDDTYIVNQYEILTYATKAIQELSAKVEKLENEIKQLKERIK